MIYDIPKSILTNCTRLYFIVLHYSIEAVFMHTKVVNFGSPEKRWGYAYSFANLKKKNLTSDIPLSIALNCFILALKLSAKAFVERLLK